MKRTSIRWSLVALLGFLLAAPSQAQPVDTLLIQGKHLLTDGFNHADLDKINEARAIFERATTDEGRAALAHYYAAMANNRLAGLLLQSDEKKGMAHIDQAIDHLQKATKIDKDFAEAHALLSSIYGRKVGVKPLLGMVMGPKADKAIKTAEKLEPENPRIIFVKSMSKFHKPAAWGGDMDGAMAGLQHAAELFAQEKQTDPLLPSWGHDETYAWLGIAFMNREDYAQATAMFDKALAVNPDFGWVKVVLKPQLAEKMGS